MRLASPMPTAKKFRQPTPMIPRTGRRGANRYESKRGEEVNMPEEKDLQLNEIEGDPAPRAATVDDDLNMPQGARDLEAVSDIPVQVSAVLGQADRKSVATGTSVSVRVDPGGRRII